MVRCWWRLPITRHCVLGCHICFAKAKFLASWCRPMRWIVSGSLKMMESFILGMWIWLESSACGSLRTWQNLRFARSMQREWTWPPWFCFRCFTRWYWCFHTCQCVDFVESITSNNSGLCKRHMRWWWTRKCSWWAIWWLSSRKQRNRFIFIMGAKVRKRS